jgi:hypothetical protein
MLRQTLRHRASPLPFPYFFPSYCDVSEARSYFMSTVPTAMTASNTHEVTVRKASIDIPTALSK